MPLLNCTTPLWAPGAPGAAVAAAKAPPPPPPPQPSKQQRLHCEVGVVKDSSGSSFVTLGGASVLCSVHGPRTSQRGVMEGLGSVECDVRYAPFSLIPSSSALATTDGASTSSNSSTTSTSKEKYLAQVVKEALLHSLRLELYPKMTISLSILVLQTSGNTGTDVSAAINAGSLALVNAMIETLDFVVATAVSISTLSSSASSSSSSSSIYTIDPGPTKDATLLVATLPSLKEMSQLFYEGNIDATAMTSLISKSRLAAEGLRTDLAQCVKTSAAPCEEEVVEDVV